MAQAVTMGAIEHIRRLLEEGCVESTDGRLGCYFCGYCRGPAEPIFDPELRWDVEHEPDCPYVAARAFIDSLEAKPG